MTTLVPIYTVVAANILFRSSSVVSERTLLLLAILLERSSLQSNETVRKTISSLTVQHTRNNFFSLFESQS